MVVVPAFFMAVNLLKKIVIIYLFLDPVIMKGRNKMKKETNVTLVTVSIFDLFADKRYAYSDLRKTCG